MQLKSYTKEYLFGNRLVKPDLKLTQYHEPPLSSLYKNTHFLSNSSFSHSLYTTKQTQSTRSDQASEHCWIVFFLLPQNPLQCWNAFGISTTLYHLPFQFSL